MALHSINHAALQLAHLKEKEAGLLGKLSRLKNETSSYDHDIEGATRRAQYQLSEIQIEIARFRQPAVVTAAPPAPAPVEPAVVSHRTSKKP